LKILITVGIYPPDIGGPASFVPKIANLYANQGHKITVICLSDSLYEDQENYKVVRILRYQNLLIRWLKTIFLILRNGHNANLLFVNGLPMESYVANLFLRKKMIRKIVGDWAWERGMNKKLINESFDEFQNKNHNLHLEIAKFSRGWTAGKAKLVITPSKHLSTIVQNWGVKEKNLKVIYNGTEIHDSYDSGIIVSKTPFTFLTVGRLAPWKNIPTIIKALKIYKKEGMQFKFYIVGSGPEEDNLKELVSASGLQNEVEFTGQLIKTELVEYYKKADIYIQASSYEGLPHVILEAISHNLSIISTPIGGTNEILLDGKNGWVWNLKNNFTPEANQLFEIINRIANNPEDDNAKKNNAKNYLIQNFDEEKNFKEYLEIIKI
tara:strand:+ start:933 stop:2075 length:1143 start_codon:yes stop_codon:yes gene_type:complete